MLQQSLPLIDALLFTLFAAVFVIDALQRVRWAGSPRDQWVWAGATLLALVGARMSVTLPEGLQMHYLGAAWLVVLLGFPRAMLSMVAVITLQMMLQQAPPSAWGLRVLLSGVLPIWAMWAVARGCRRWLPRNLFVFLFGCGMLGLMAVHALQIGMTALVLNALGGVRPAVLWGEYLPYALLLAWGEAWLEGMLTTLLVVYVPGSVRLFDEHFYLARPARRANRRRPS